LIVHCTRKLAARLREVSSERLEEARPLGSWHANLYQIDRRQCLLFCHDATRYCLFLPGLRAEHLKELGRWHRELFLASLATAGAKEAVLKKIELAFGAPRFDTATDRSVLESMTIARWDLDGMLMRVDNVLDLDPVLASRHLNERPAMAGRVVHWPEREMLERIARL
jgi:hypothetical protein